MGKSSDLYHELYKKGLVKDYISSNYEFGRNFAHILISGQSKDPNMVLQLLKEKIAKIKEKGISTEEFERSKKKLYGSYVRDFDEIDDISRMFLADYFQGINSFECGRFGVGVIAPNASVLGIAPPSGRRVWIWLSE